MTCTLGPSTRCAVSQNREHYYNKATFVRYESSATVWPACWAPLSPNMSWLRQEPSVVLEDNDDEITSTRSRPTMEEVQARNRALQALLSTEQEAHSQSRAALDVSRRQEKESLYKVGVAPHFPPPPPAVTRRVGASH